MSATYATREMIKGATDGLSSARLDARIDRALEASSRDIDKLCLRPENAFVPVTATRTFDWPSGSQPFTDEIYFDPHSLRTATSVTSGGVVIPAADYLLRPAGGTSYRWMEIDKSSDSALSIDETDQESVSIVGVWVLGGEDVTAGALTAAVSSTSATTVYVSAAGAALVGVGSVLLVDTERLTVTGRSLTDTAVNTGGALTDSLADTSVSVASGSAFAAGETIVIDTERMTIDDIAGNSLIVSRGADRTAVAAHLTAADIYAYRALTVTRGALGTAAATHADAAAISLFRPSGLVERLCTALTLVQLAHEAGAYATQSGANDSRRPLLGGGLSDLRDQVFAAYGRKMRHKAV